MKYAFRRFYASQKKIQTMYLEKLRTAESWNYLKINIIGENDLFVGLYFLR